MDYLTNNYVGRAAAAFLTTSQSFTGDLAGARGTIMPFLEQFFPVLRHYRAEVVGHCLALSHDDPALARTSELHGFGLYMCAGDHRHDRDSRLGSYHDDGSYLALQAHDYFQYPTRQTR